MCPHLQSLTASKIKWTDSKDVDRQVRAGQGGWDAAGRTPLAGRCRRRRPLAPALPATLPTGLLLSEV